MQNCWLSGPRTSISTVAEQVVHTETEDSFPLVNPEVDSEVTKLKLSQQLRVLTVVDFCAFLVGTASFEL